MFLFKKEIDLPDPDLSYATINNSTRKIDIFSKDGKKVVKRLLFNIPSNLPNPTLDTIREFTSSWNMFGEEVQQQIANIIDGNSSIEKYLRNFSRRGKVELDLQDNFIISNPRNCLVIEDSPDQTVRLDIGIDIKCDHRTISKADNSYQDIGKYGHYSSPEEKVLYSGHIADVTMKGLKQAVTVVVLDSLIQKYSPDTDTMYFDQPDNERTQMFASLGIFLISTMGPHPDVELYSKTPPLTTILNVRRNE